MTDAVAEFTPTAEKPIFITEACQSKLEELIKEEGNENLKLRIFIAGGGCSGYQTSFALEEIPNDDDLIMNYDRVSVVVDSMSLTFLAGATVDYKEDISGAQFVIKNPNAASTCGCGSSFSM